MKSYDYFIGIDISKDSFDAGGFTRTAEAPCYLGHFSNSDQGILQFIQQLTDRQIQPPSTLICVEATGVYSNRVCEQLYRHGFEVCLEAPLKIKRAFPLKTHKTDAIDAIHIAEYAYRYADRLLRWEPKSLLINTLETLLALREQLVKQRTALSNFIGAIQIKSEGTEEALAKARELMDFLNQQFQEVENQIFQRAAQEASLAEKIERLATLPGIGPLTALNLTVLTTRYPSLVNYKKLAAYIGICPFRKQSGTSLNKPARISQLGPPRLRKLLHLCARSVSFHHHTFQSYYLRLVNQGKAKKLAINNVSNKLLRIACAMLQNHQPFIENYYSVHPKFR